MQSTKNDGRIAILGAGNIGQAMAKGLINHAGLAPSELCLTRRHVDALEEFHSQGIFVTTDNPSAAQRAELVILAVEPRQVKALAQSIRPALTQGPPKIVVSVASGVPISDLTQWLGQATPILRAMPNTASALGQSMTCLTAGNAATNANQSKPLQQVESIFNKLGETLVIDEELMTQATALAACGIAFFLRAIRAASQGGIEIGFHPAEALKLAAQTALGAATLVSQGPSPTHPESAIDSVTTPRGCTIAGLNEMEHRGFSSAIIRGIVTSATKAAE
jgi:pyrroline-5-carboxylate reductase